MGYENTRGGGFWPAKPNIERASSISVGVGNLLVGWMVGTNGVKWPWSWLWWAGGNARTSGGWGLTLKTEYRVRRLNIGLGWRIPAITRSRDPYACIGAAFEAVGPCNIVGIGANLSKKKFYEFNKRWQQTYLVPCHLYIISLPSLLHLSPA